VHGRLSLLHAGVKSDEKKSANKKSKTFVKWLLIAKRTLTLWKINPRLAKVGDIFKKSRG
jgi:hypothetical protein